jgi:hypothetical protein
MPMTEEAKWKALARELTGWEVMQRIEAGHDVALLPVGSMELHGPQLPLGTDTVAAEAACRMAAPAMKGTVFDTVTYSWPGCTKYSKPTISMTMDAETSYTRMVCDQLARVGFRRIYVVQFHGPGIAMMRLARDFFEETGVPLALYRPLASDCGRAEADEKGIAWEASLCAAAGEFLGLDLTISPEAGSGTETPKLPGGEARNRIRSTGGFVGFLGTHDSHHGPFSGTVDLEFGHRILSQFAEQMASSVDDMSEIRDAWKDVDLESSWPSGA